GMVGDRQERCDRRAHDHGTVAAGQAGREIRLHTTWDRRKRCDAAEQSAEMAAQYDGAYFDSSQSFPRRRDIYIKLPDDQIFACLAATHKGHSLAAFEAAR